MKLAVTGVVASRGCSSTLFVDIAGLITMESVLRGLKLGARLVHQLGQHHARPGVATETAGCRRLAQAHRHAHHHRHVHRTFVAAPALAHCQHPASSFSNSSRHAAGLLVGTGLCGVALAVMSQATSAEAEAAPPTTVELVVTGPTHTGHDR